MKKIKTLVRKEIPDILRDKKTLVIMVLIPVRSVNISSRPSSSAPPPVSIIPLSTISAASSGGVRSNTL